MSEEFKTIFIEFNQPVYAGEGGYVTSIALDQTSPLALGRLKVVAHWQKDGMWFFNLLDGKCVAVPNSNVRYVFGSLASLQADAVPETPSNYVSHKFFKLDASSVQTMEEFNKREAGKADADLLNTLAPPKRRGRPPKVKE